MREIEFRAKRQDNGEWVFGYIYHDQRFLHGESCCDVMCIKNDCDEEYVIIPESIGQFTGLLDKNNQRIYEGDRFNWSFDKDLEGEIVFHEGAFGHINKLGTYGNYTDFVPISKARARNMILIKDEKKSIRQIASENGFEKRNKEEKRRSFELATSYIK